MNGNLVLLSTSQYTTATNITVKNINNYDYIMFYSVLPSGIATVYKIDVQTLKTKTTLANCTVYGLDPNNSYTSSKIYYRYINDTVLQIYTTNKARINNIYGLNE